MKAVRPLFNSSTVWTKIPPPTPPVSSYFGPSTKPDPEPYLRALAITGRSPAECVAVEDSERGLAAAKAAHMEEAQVAKMTESADRDDDNDIAK